MNRHISGNVCLLYDRINKQIGNKLVSICGGKFSCNKVELSGAECRWIFLIG